METNTVYAIYDNVGKAIIGGLHLHKHQAAAVRFYQDVATAPGTLLAKHAEDYDLVQLGHLKDTALQSDFKVVLQGKVWKATQQPDMQDKNQLALTEN